DRISVGATETLMMAAVLTKGKTILKNCAKEPEIANVAEWLNSCGANIKGIGTSTIEIEGTNGELLKPKAIYTAIPDRIETGSFLILGALCAEELTINNCEPKHLESVVNLLKNAGVPINSTDSTLSIIGNSKTSSSFKAFNIKTEEYPGFPTDLQAPMAVFLTQVAGGSTIEENIFEGRFKYVGDLKKMGARIIEKGPREIEIKGPTLLESKVGSGQNHSEFEMELNAHDIRAGFAIVLAALVGEGKFKVNNAHLIDRGYESLEKKLQALGASIKRV
ncbi:MAG: UDP-N-acetylglucosamine 1-carboxyvinyltransferase, partial [Patescibacteria group bacterium]